MAAWIAVDTNGKVTGQGSEHDMIQLACAACDQLAKSRSENYEEYQEQVIELAKGMAIGLLDGGIDYFLRK